MLPKGSPGAFCVSASFRQGKALVLKDNGMFRGGIAVVSADIFAAEVDLISDTFALAGVAGFAGIDGNGVGSFGHEILLSCCSVAVDAAIVAWQAIFHHTTNGSVKDVTRQNKRGSQDV